MTTKDSKTGANKQKVKAQVKIKEAGKKYKPKDEYYKKQGDHIAKADEKTESQKMPSYIRSKETPIPTKQAKGKRYKVVYPNGKVKRFYDDAEGVMWEILAAGRTRVSEESAKHIREGSKKPENPNNPAHNEVTAGAAKFSRVKPPPNTIAGKTNPDAVAAEYKPGDFYNTVDEKWENVDPETRLANVESREARNYELMQQRQKAEAADLERRKKEYELHRPVRPGMELTVAPTKAIVKKDYRSDAGSMVDGAMDVASGVATVARKAKKKLSGLKERAKEKGNQDFVSGPIEEVGVRKAWEDYQIKKDILDDITNSISKQFAEMKASGKSFEEVRAWLEDALKNEPMISPYSRAYLLRVAADAWGNESNQKSVSRKKPNTANAVLRTHKEAIKENPSIGPMKNVQLNQLPTSQETADYDKKVKQTVQKNIYDQDDDPLPEDYPNSYYQKLWEHLEDSGRDNIKPTRGKSKPKNISGAERLSNVMSRTAAEPQYSREEVIRIANALRAALGREQWKPRTPARIAGEDEKIKGQLNELWDETETKPMTEKPKIVKKEMQHLYGMPVEDLPETESPPPILYKTIEPTKKKGKV
jgi:hypothetical protein